jgi:hypothetical protein
VGYPAAVVRLEATNDLPARRNNTDVTIIASEEQAIRPRTDTRYLVAFDEVPRVVIGQLDLVDLEEVE